jgi:hypothetical protein
MNVSTLLAANTSSAVAKAGRDKACVSIPMNRAPSTPAERLANRQDMRLVESAIEGGSAMA